MKVKDILPKKQKLEKEFKVIQSLEKLFQQDKKFADELADKINSNIPLDKLFTEIRMNYSDKIYEIDDKINNAEIKE